MRQVQSLRDRQACHLVHFSCASSYEALVVLDMLDRIRDGFFEAVFLLPLAASWSRARHNEDETRRPGRNRTHPAGLPELSATASIKAAKGNRDIES